MKDLPRKTRKFDKPVLKPAKYKKTFNEKTLFDQSALQEVINYKCSRECSYESYHDAFFLSNLANLNLLELRKIMDINNNHGFNKVMKGDNPVREHLERQKERENYLLMEQIRKSKGRMTTSPILDDPIDRENKKLTEEIEKSNGRISTSPILDEHEDESFLDRVNLLDNCSKGVHMKKSQNLHSKQSPQTKFIKKKSIFTKCLT